MRLIVGVCCHLRSFLILKEVILRIFTWWAQSSQREKAETARPLDELYRKVKVISHIRLYTVHGILQARILEWVAFPFSMGSSQPRDQTQVSHIAGGFFTS